MKQLLIFSLLLLSTFFAWSQTPNQAAPKAPPETIAAIRPIEDSLMVILDSLAEQSSRDTLARLKYYKNDRRRELSQQLAKTLIQALKVPNSFNYPFDSIKNYITIVQPDDRSFRIFTWPLITLNYNVNNPSSSEESYQYYGAIQMNNPELKLHGLFDKSGSLASPEYETTNNNMNNKFHLNFILILSLLLIFQIPLFSQVEKIGLEKDARLVNPLYELNVRNIVIINSDRLSENTLTFDLVILHTNLPDSGPFYFAALSSCSCG